MLARAANAEKLQDIPADAIPGVQFALGKNIRNVGVYLTTLPEAVTYRPAGPCFNLFTSDHQGPNAQAWRFKGWNVQPVEIAPEKVLALVILDDDVAWSYRCLGPLMPHPIMVLPGWKEALVSEAIRAQTRESLRDPSTRNIVRYVSASGLKGHYLEFGTFIGWSMLNNYFQLAPWLEGNFYGFDSFAGLSKPSEDEKKFTNNDFYEGGYSCNEISFRANCEMLGMDMTRLKTVPGFYEKSLRGKNGFDYGVAPESVSVCAIDCDLFEPTRDVLDFVAPLLEPGALIYFDDWLLCRASPNTGERGAALTWLKENPSFELIEFDHYTWQSRWFVFQKKQSP